MSGICGGIISESYMDKQEMLYGVWATAMAYWMPDKWFAEYERAIKKSKNMKYGRDRRRAEKKYAEFILQKYGRSQI